MSLTKEQWDDLARFCDLVVCEKAGDGVWVHEAGAEPRGQFQEIPWRLWNPSSGWSDFGPLWMMLEKHLWNNRVDAYPDPECNRFFSAQQGNNEQALMQAGCELGAAIGKAMREGK